MITFTDPTTNKTYAFKGRLVPLSRVTTFCQDGAHLECTSAPQHLIKFLDLELTKSMCCLCDCHGEGK